MNHSPILRRGFDQAPRSAKEIPESIATGKIGHSLVVVALSYYEHWRRKHR